jgi:hypothetical protein
MRKRRIVRMIRAWPARGIKPGLPQRGDGFDSGTEIEK